MKALVIPVEGPLEEMDLPDGVKEQLTKLQEIVGGYIESVPIPAFIADANQATAIVNEEGKYMGLKPNMRATDFMVPGRGIGWGDYIAGSMVLLGFDPRDGLHKDVPGGVVIRAKLIEQEA